MEVLKFPDFQKEIESIGFKNPKLKFDFQSIKITTLPYFNDILAQLFIWTISTFLVLNDSTLFAGVLFFAASLYFFYFHFIGLGICKIDFSAKSIKYKNRISIFNFIRKWFGFKHEIEFSNIKQITCKEGLLLDRLSGGYATRYQLLIETFDLPGVTITQFKTEKDAKNVAAILNKYILHKEKIIA